MIWVLLLLLAAPVAAAEVRFNRDVRPILSDRCYACQGPDRANRKTKMRLDGESDAKADLGKGRFAIVAGAPEKSEIWKRIVSPNRTLRMPPAYLGHEALQPREAAIIRQWIEQGAKYEPHWAFVPPARPAAPAVREAAWVRNPIDAFILSRLEGEGLRPAPEADRRTLMRRVSLDLTGLPPTPAEVDAFVRDSSPAAYEKLVDRLLGTTRYAERMAIRWLEAARYADTNGYQTDGPRTMWQWRDWVVNAFHRDQPWDQFTIEQIAGDLLPGATLEQKIATGFHRNHRTSAEGGIVDEEFRVEYVADRAETTSTVWLGLTVGCARCHDHKFDPISQRDYYSLFAYFNNVPERGFVWDYGNEDPLLRTPSPEQRKRLAELDTQVAAARAEVQRLEAQRAKAQAKWERSAARKNVDWSVTEGQTVHVPAARAYNGKEFYAHPDRGPTPEYQDPITLAAWIEPASASGAILARGEDDLEGRQIALLLVEGKLRLHMTFRWSDLSMRLETVQPLALKERQHVAVTYDGGKRASGVRVYVNGERQPVRVLLDQLLHAIEIKDFDWRVGAGAGFRFTGRIADARVYARALSPAEVAALSAGETVSTLAARAQRTAAEESKLRLCFDDRFAPKNVRKALAGLKAAEAERAKFEQSIPTMMVMREEPGLRDAFVLKRGAYDARGEKVLPAVPQALSGGALPPDRLGLARWLADRGNPLTARVAVNRFWAMLFGVGIVKTVEDFGSQGEWPVHPDLLDWLAVEFMDSGWSVKRIVKTMVMSAAYRQSSRVTPELHQRDPDNRLLARGPRFRLPAEMIRDQALAVAGLLADRVGGPPVKPYQPPGLWQELTGGRGYKEDEGEGLYRRTLYSYWRRTIPPPAMINFDSPTREVCTVRESRTNTPLQALNLMNEVTFVEASRKLAERMLQEGGSDPVTRGFALVLGRAPRPRERAAADAALAKFRSVYRAKPGEAEALLQQGKSPRDRGIPAAELAAYTAVASLLLNLDETVTKE
ncbi:MAG TPA: hypothetical protein DEH78_16170 [Solibacterales bacterium]|nr:hypothetical protein [Bryobacterales bacterium]